MIALAALALPAVSDASRLTFRSIPDPVVQRTGARCLDGSAPAYYIRRGTGPGYGKWKIHLSGGGWCTTEQECFSRAYTEPAVLGSSLSWSRPYPAGPNETDWNLGVYGLLADDSGVGVFQNWTAVFVRYCDGSSFSSARESPVTVSGKPLWFRGRAVLTAVIDDLLQQGMSHASEVVLAGTSAGAVAVYMHAETLRGMLPSSARLAAVPDAGLFVDVVSVAGRRSFREMLQKGMRLWNEPGQPPFTNKKCLEAYPDDQWRCYFGQYLIEFISVPVFAVNSMYDSAGMSLVLGGSCDWGDLAAASEQCRDRAQGWRRTFVDAVSGPLARSGSFLTACNQHEETCRTRDFEGVVVSGRSMSAAVSDWYADCVRGGCTGNHTTVDGLWPTNHACWVGGYHGAC